MNRTLKERLLEFLAKHPHEKFKQKVLARRLSITDPAEYHALQKLLKDLHQEGEIGRGKSRRYTHAVPPAHHQLTGVFHLERNGSGFVQLLPPMKGKVSIAPRFMQTALDGDTVRVVAFEGSVGPGDGDGSVPEGEIIDVLERNPRPIVGTLEKGKNFFFVVPDQRGLERDIYIPKGKTLGARPGDKVVVQIDAWESRNLNPEGHIVEQLGKSGDVLAEMKSVARKFSLPLSFPRSVLEAARSIPEKIPPAEIARRLDLRELICFTIDPEDAKDFDDAVSLEPLDDSHFRLGVHIADVSHYVTDGSILDEEARKRGTSVYLANDVIPMLPEKLSNDICSLRPDVDRLTYSVLMTVSKQGTVRSYEIHKTVITSKRRFSYGEVQDVITGKRGPFSREIIAMYHLSQALLKGRLKNGALDFDTTEIKFRYDESGKPVEILQKSRLDAHRLIEEFMLLANRTVAEHIGISRKEDQIRPFIYRVHDVPPPEKMKDFCAFVEHLGYSFPIDQARSSVMLQKLLDKVRGTEEENVINEVAIRSMAKAVYSDFNIGHYGLAFRHYTHFTSPIRRYPDLMVHRLLNEYSLKMPYQRRKQVASLLPGICDQSTERERVAQDAERASVKVMQIEYMKRHLGEEFHAIISGVVKFGLFVEITDLLVEGLIHIRDLDDDYYLFDEKQFSLTGRSTRRRYRLGDKVTIQVIRVDPEEGEIDFRLVTPEHVTRRKKSRR